MANLKWLLGLVMFSSVAAAMDGSSSGGGGNAVVCYGPQGEIKSVELFDYWEQSQLSSLNFKIDLGPSDLPVKDKIFLALERIRNLDSKRALQYAADAEKVLAEIKNYPYTPAFKSPNDDSSQIFPAAPCVKESFVIQNPSPRFGQGRFIVRPDLYHHPKTSNDTRAGIILHETIYKLAMEEGIQTSDGVRYFNYILSTRYLENNPTSYLDIAEGAGFKTNFERRDVWYNGNLIAQARTTFNHGIGCISTLDPVSYHDETLTINLVPGDCLHADSRNELDFFTSLESNLPNVLHTSMGDFKVLSLRIFPDSKTHIFTPQDYDIETKTFRASISKSSLIGYNLAFKSNSLTNYYAGSGIFEDKGVSGAIGENSVIEFEKSTITLRLKGSADLGEFGKISFKFASATLDENAHLKSLTIGEEIIFNKGDATEFKGDTIVYTNEGLFAEKLLEKDHPQIKLFLRSRYVHPTDASATKFCQGLGFDKAKSYHDAGKPEEWRIQSYDLATGKIYDYKNGARHIGKLVCSKLIKIKKIEMVKK